MSILQVAEDLRVRILSLYDKHLDEGGRAVDYEGLAGDSDFAAFVNATAELQTVDMSGLERKQKMAFWINIYNILVVQPHIMLFPLHAFCDSCSFGILHRDIRLRCCFIIYFPSA